MSLYSNKVRKKIEKNIQNRIRLENKMKQIQEKEKDDIAEFYSGLDSATIFSVIDVVTQHGHPEQKKQIQEFAQKYQNQITSEEDCLKILDYIDEFEKEIIELNSNKVEATRDLDKIGAEE